MRLFQNCGVYPAYLRHFNRIYAGARSFPSRQKAYLDDRYGGCHLLKPVIDADQDAFFTNGDDLVLQRMWAQEKGIAGTKSLEEILLAQIEEHRTEVLYNTDPMRYGSAFVRRLPGCVRKTVCWRSAPSPGADFAAYDLVVCNFPSIIESWRRSGWNAAYFAPATDPEMDAYAANGERPIDVLFIGGYSRHHSRRASVLLAVSLLAKRLRVSYRLDDSRVTKIADSPLGVLPGLAKFRKPLQIRRVTSDPVYGRDLYRAIASAKIVLNGAIDMAGDDRGNMRCFEALGCGALMVSDEGNYPAGFVAGETMLTYRNPDEAAAQIAEIRDDWDRGREIARKGLELVRTRYSKSVQWKKFLELVA